MSRGESGGDGGRAEHRRLTEAEAVPAPWKVRRLLDKAERGQEWRKWGPYLSERQWGTVREDYSPDGTAWEYFPHDHARSRAYRWGEDGIAGFSDDKQYICLSLALWNENDPILKERLFGLTGNQGNHGEDVKEYYYYLDATPTHSYLKCLYRYPQAEFPYLRLEAENRRRGKRGPEFELLDTGVFEEDRYFDVFVEYVKNAPEDILWRISAYNRGPEPAPLHLLPQLWFRNTWSWQEGSPRPEVLATSERECLVRHPKLGEYVLSAGGDCELLFCDNETNARRLYGMPEARGFFKDAFHDGLVGRDPSAVNPEKTGTKVGIHFSAVVPAQGECTVRLRLAREPRDHPFEAFDDIVDQRRREADDFYADLQSKLDDGDARQVQRQALAGLIWSKQFYHLDIRRWLEGDPARPAPPPQRKLGRNSDWEHLNCADIISMPDKWEYPWFAAWDLAFHCLPFSLIDTEFAKSQLVLLTREWYMHPNGQLPAYEWALSDVNPPVHAWAAWRVYQIDRTRHGHAGDLAFLERVFHKLMLNFTWWVNRKDTQGRNIFHGGFLGLDNIGVFDRNAPLPMGGHINQADGTSWMAMYSLNLLRIALELARHNPVYEDVATKFFEHFLHIAKAMTDIAGEGIGLWDEEDEFYYDVLSLPNGENRVLRLRSMVGLVPLFAVEVLEPELLEELPDFTRRLQWFLDYRPDLASLVSRWHEPGRGDRRLLSLLRGHRMKCLLRRMLDETEFLSEYGVRGLSRVYEGNPYEFSYDGHTLTVGYEPAESVFGFFGGNSNWRGPVWMPMNYLIIESLQKFHHYYGDEFKIECPTGSGQFTTINGVAEELIRRLTGLFRRGHDGTRPALAQCGKLCLDPRSRDHLLFHEYFDGNTGRGLGASHQTGWTGLIAKLLQPRRAPCH